MEMIRKLHLLTRNVVVIVVIITAIIAVTTVTIVAIVATTVITAIIATTVATIVATARRELWRLRMQVSVDAVSQLLYMDVLVLLAK